jgi:hypothetical protein
MSRKINHSELESYYEHMINSENPLVEISAYRYNAADVLKAVDPVAYRTGLNDYADYLVKSGLITEGWD